jgi:hypothetical protein
MAGNILECCFLDYDIVTLVEFTKQSLEGKYCLNIPVSLKLMAAGSSETLTITREISDVMSSRL